MILEASGKNLALFEYANMLKLGVLFGLSAQCYLHAIPHLFSQSAAVIGGASLAMLALLGVCLGVFESLAVKLNWRKAPEFVAYSLTLSLMASIVALGIKAI